MGRRTQCRPTSRQPGRPRNARYRLGIPQMLSHGISRMRTFASEADGLSTQGAHPHRMVTRRQRGMTMRAAVATGSSIEVRDDVPDPTPRSGQVLVHTIVCGICGSDLHALEAPEEMAQLNAAGGAASVVHPGDPYVLGHEFTAEIVDYGPGTEGSLAVGSTVCALPYAMGPAGLEVIGFSPTLPGGFGELMVLQETI